MKPISRIYRLAIAGVLAASLIATAAYAQGRVQRGGQFGPGGGLRADAKECILQAANELGLTEQQRASIAQRLQVTRQQAMELRSSNLDPQQKRARMIELAQASRADIEQMLTPDQRERAKEMWAQRGAAVWGQRGMAARGGFGLEQLDLTTAQKEQIAAIRSETQLLVQGVRADATLTPDQRLESIKTIRADGHARVLQVLTPEQRQQLEEWRADRPKFGEGAGMRGMRGGGTRDGMRGGARDGVRGGMRGGPRDGSGAGMMRNPGPWCPVPAQS